MRLRLSAALALAVALLLALLPNACMTFNGLEAAGADASLRPDGAHAGADAQAPGLDAQAIPPDAALPPGYLSVDDAVRACTLSFSCKNLWQSIWMSLAVPIDQTNFSLCVDWLAGPIPASHPGIDLQTADLECVAKAANCQAAGNCLAFDRLEPGDSRCLGDAGLGESCYDSQTALMCDAMTAWHCDNAYFSPNQTCIKASDGYLYCAIGEGCATYGCIGELFYGCWGGQGDLQAATNCTHNGESCGEVPVPDAGDSPTYACLTGTQELECGPNLDARCSGTQVQICDEVYFNSYECAELGGTCAKTGGVVQCRLPDPGCLVSDSDVNVCQADGKTLTLCVAGTKVSFDCSKLQKTCKPASGGQSGRCG